MTFDTGDSSPIPNHRKLDSLCNIPGESSRNFFYPLSASGPAFIHNPFAVHNDHFFPAESAYERLLSLLQSQLPWKVTPELLFCICRILEETLPLSPRVAPGPGYCTLLPVLRKMRAWRLMERRSLEGLASDLAGLVDIELSAPCDTLESSAKRKTRDGSDQADDKENISALKNTFHNFANTMKKSRSRHTTSLNDLFGEPVPAFRRQCVACEALRTVSISSTAVQNIQRTLQHTHGNDGLAFPRPPPPSSSVHSRSRSNLRTSLLPKSDNPVIEVTKAATSGLRPALGAMNGGSRSNSHVTNVNFPMSVPMFHVEDDTDYTLNEVRIERRSQEEGWRP